METNYNEVYEVICKYYPIGINPNDPLYGDFSGSILFQQLAWDKIEPSQFNKWKSLVKELKKENPEVKDPDRGCFTNCVNSVTLNYRHNYGNTRRL